MDGVAGGIVSEIVAIIVAQLGKTTVLSASPAPATMILRWHGEFATSA